MAGARFNLDTRCPPSTFGISLGPKQGTWKKTHPRGHHLSDEEISYYRRDGIPADRVRALLYGGIDCPKVDCRGRCKIKDKTSQVQEIQDNSIWARQDSPSAPSLMQHRSSTTIERTLPIRRTLSDQPAATSSPSIAKLLTTKKPATEEAHFKAASRTKPEAMQEEVVRKIAEQAKRKKEESHCQSLPELEMVEASHVTFTPEQGCQMWAKWGRLAELSTGQLSGSQTTIR